MALLFSVFLCAAIGFLLVRLFWPVSRAISSSVLQGSFAVGFGLGLFSVIFVMVRILHFSHLFRIDVSVFMVLLVVALIAGRRTTRIEFSAKDSEAIPLWFNRTLQGVFCLAFVAALYSAVMWAFAHPHGNGWDSFAIWNLHARFLFLDPENWREGFSALIPWSHPDYPLLLPGAIAHFWSVLGHETQIVPVAIALFFTFGTVAVLFSALNLLRGKIAAFFGGIVLLATPAFVEIGTSQYADIPLGFFFLCTLILLCISEDVAARGSNPSGLLVLAGVSAGFAAWTKNEGLLFFCALIASWAITFFRHNLSYENTRMRFLKCSHLLLAAAPVLALVFYFKHEVASKNEIFADSSTTLSKLLSAPRYWAILSWFVKQSYRFGQWIVPLTILMLLFLFVGGKRKMRNASWQGQAGWLVLMLMLCGYFAIYLITPYPIYWHLRFSLNRLFLQLWPSTVFLFFLSVEPWIIGSSKSMIDPVPPRHSI
jgi:hypothetical protein